MRERTRPSSASATNRAVIDAIVGEWAALTGIKKTEIDKHKNPAITPGVCDQYARARMTTENLAKCVGGRAGTSSAGPEQLGASQARACANDFDPGHAKPAPLPATVAPEFLTASMRANESGLCHATRAGAQANKSGSLPAVPNQARVICGARRRRDGQPCQGLSVPGKRQCKWHGGASTGPRTDEGRARSLANLRQYRSHDAGSA